MPKQKKQSSSSFKIKEMDLKEAQREFNRRRGRGSKYDSIIEAAEQLDKGKALLVEGLTYSEVTGVRKRLSDLLGEAWSVSATKTNKEKGLYDALIQREK